MPLPPKAELRKTLLRRRLDLPAGERRAMDAAIGENILSAAAHRRGDIVGGYAPFRGEADILPALAALEQWGAHLCLPVIRQPGKPLAFHAWKSGGPLAPNAHGIAEPSPQAPELLPDLLLLPLLGFDSHGTRLGYGGGYYDRTLRELREINGGLLAVGVAYGMQHVPFLPRERHDAPLDMVITEKAVYDFQGLR